MRLKNGQGVNGKGVIDLGCVRQWRNGQYYIDYLDNNKKRVRETVGPNKRQAETVLSKRQVELAENRCLNVKKREKIKFKDFADTFLEKHCKLNNVSWRKGAKVCLDNLILFFGEKYLYEISPVLIEDYKLFRTKSYKRVTNKSYSKKLNTKVLPATINRELATLSSLFNRAIEWEVADTNPAAKVKRLKEENQRTVYLTDEEIEKLLQVSPPKLYAIVTLAIQTGARQGEILNLKWDDIDFEKDQVWFLKTKNGEKRCIQLNAIAKRVLLGLDRHPTSRYVFCKKDGNIFNCRKSFETAKKNSGILKNFRFHDLRHTCASQLIMKTGVDLYTVGQILGHKSSRMTERYSHLSPEHQKDALDTMASKMDSIWTVTQKLPKNK